jgi:hypothetical protein
MHTCTPIYRTRQETLMTTTAKRRKGESMLWTQLISIGGVIAEATTINFITKVRKTEREKEERVIHT